MRRNAEGVSDEMHMVLCRKDQWAGNGGHKVGNTCKSCCEGIEIGDITLNGCVHPSLKLTKCTWLKCCYGQRPYVCPTLLPWDSNCQQRVGSGVVGDLSASENAAAATAQAIAVPPSNRNGRGGKDVAGGGGGGGEGGVTGDGAGDRPAADSRANTLHCEPVAWKVKVAELTWDRWKIRNAEKQYSYGKWDGHQYSGEFRLEACLRCKVCQHWIYRSDVAPGVIPDNYLDFQKNYSFICKRCNVQDDCQTEIFKLTRCENWIDAIESAMAYKTWTEQRKLWKVAELQEFITEPEHWRSLCYGRPPPETIGENGWDPNPYFTRNQNKVVVQKALHHRQLSAISAHA
eukprot:COSAG02_NODE_8391_length_2587_cov_2.391479_3_plen_344_part_01